MDQENKKLLTRNGYQRLADEFNHLRNVERPVVVGRIADAAAEGDRSENAEYIYGKKRLRELDKRLKYLGGLLKDVRLVDPSKVSSTKVSFGATVLLLDENGQESTYMIVGEGESDIKSGTISYRSPVAKALMNKAVGDVALIIRPAGDQEVEIIDIKYTDTPPRCEIK